MNLQALIEEVMGYIADVGVMFNHEGDRLYSNYQKITAYTLRLSEIHNQIAILELNDEADNHLKKFRTSVLDPTIERFDKIASFESRKITAKRIELDMER